MEECPNFIPFFSSSQHGIFPLTNLLHHFENIFSNLFQTLNYVIRLQSTYRNEIFAAVGVNYKV